MPTSLKRTLTETVTEFGISFHCGIRNSECFPQIYSVAVATERGKRDNKGEQIWIRLF